MGGQCRYGRACKWDHPEVRMNSKGYPMRPGQQTCGYYARSGICKFGQTCRFDHPEVVSNGDSAGTGAALAKAPAVVPPPPPQPYEYLPAPAPPPISPLLQEEEQQMMLQQFKSEIQEAKIGLRLDSWA